MNLPRRYGFVVGAIITGAVVVFLVYNLASPGKAKAWALYEYAAKDKGDDEWPQIAYGKGKWIVVWQSNDDLKGGTKANYDILVTSSENGEDWTPAKALYPGFLKYPHNDGDDTLPHIATDGKGHWLIVWNSRARLSSTMSYGDLEEDEDILYMRSLTNGGKWESPKPLNRNADYDWKPGDGPKADDSVPRVATNGKYWTVIWQGNSKVGASDGGCGCSTNRDNARIYTQTATDLEFKAFQEIDWSFTTCAGSSEANMPGDLAAGANGHWVAVFPTHGSVDDDPNIPYTLDLGPDSDLVFMLSDNNGLAPFHNQIHWTSPDKSPPDTLASYSASDGAKDSFFGLPGVATDGKGNFVIVWHSEIAELEINGKTEKIGQDLDILVVRSDDNGSKWTDPKPLNTNAGSDVGHDGAPNIATDGKGNWVVVWQSNEDMKGIGKDYDILVASSTDNGKTWTDPVPLHKLASTDKGDDWNSQIATDGDKWVVVWQSDEDGGTGLDIDILVTSFTLPLT